MNGARSRMHAGGVNVGLLAVELGFRSVPPFVASRLRTMALRAIGVRIGRTSAFWGLPTLIGPGPITERLTIGEHTGLNEGCFFELAATVTLGHHVAVGHDVMFLTRSFEIGSGHRRAGSELRAPVVIEDGAWLGARCTIMPGVTIGAGAVIGAAAVVTKNVPPNTLILGTQKVSLARWR